MTGTDKTHLNISIEFWLKAGLQRIAEKKGITITQIIAEAITQKHPEILEYKTKVIRRII
jgi:hypothetical protein